MSWVNPVHHTMHLSPRLFNLVISFTAWLSNSFSILWYFLWYLLWYFLSAQSTLSECPYLLSRPSFSLSAFLSCSFQENELQCQCTQEVTEQAVKFISFGTKKMISAEGKMLIKWSQETKQQLYFYDKKDPHIYEVISGDELALRVICSTK